VQHLRRWAVSGALECFECGVVGVGEGVEVFLGGAEAAVAEAFFDGLDVGAAGEEPGGVGVAEVVEPDRVSELGGRRRGGPDVVAEPAAGVPVGVDDPGASGVVFAGRASGGSVGRERGLAVRAATLAEGRR
jgi:hypothetical protein